METVHVLMAGLAVVILFILGLENFSAGIGQISGERFRCTLARSA